MIYAYLPDGRTETSRFFPHLCDERAYSPEERAEAIIAHGAALGLADRAEFAARSTFWSVARCKQWLDAFGDESGAGGRSTRRTASPGVDAADVDGVLRRARSREGRADSEPVPATPPRAAAPVAADGDVEALLLRFRAREGRRDAEVAVVSPPRPVGPVTGEGDVGAVLRRARQREGRD